MTPEQEIARYKKDWEPYWERLMNNPEFRKAVEDRNAVKVGEMANAQINGDFDSQISAARGWPRRKFKPRAN